MVSRSRNETLLDDAAAMTTSLVTLLEPAEFVAVNFVLYVFAELKVYEAFWAVESVVPFPSKSQAHEVGEPVLLSAN